MIRIFAGLNSGGSGMSVNSTASRSRRTGPLNFDLLANFTRKIDEKNSLARILSSGAYQIVSVQAMSWVISNSTQKGNCFVVLLMIANHARSDGTGAWPSIATLAKESRISDRTVQTVIKRLIRKGELTVQTSKGPHGCNLYTLPLVAGGGEESSPPPATSGRV